MSEWVYRDCPTCVQVDELEPEDSTNPVDWYGTLHEPIVRCRDCKFCMSYWGADYCDFFSHVTNDPDGFCSWAERREEDGTR